MESGTKFSIKRSQRIRSKKKNKKNKNKHHNQDARRGQTGTGPTGIIRTSPNYQGGRGGRGGRVDMNQQHVQSTIIRFEEPKPSEPKDLIHQFKIKFNPWVMKKNGTNIQENIEVICKSIFI